MTQYTSQLSYAAIAEVVNDEVLIMPMIETKEGVENVELGIPGQYDSELFHSTVAKIAVAAEKASINGRKVFVGLGGLEPRPDLLEEFSKRHAPIRFAMAGRDLALLLAGMTKQAAAMNELSAKLQ
ncbi:uncharacterized protein ColSpa_01453 [Colletotrichum spaethianum]|uniref:HpcH/HpaI aldolase n=1 Tax=Colletotrichum spaethianum TaxID=700344 RepID=A0AA37NTT3_9PEZI|nr:uncharacterized protein ColSpa_01453 [Colletotrichum spaethianum]GKT41272.1 hypothetical protein ColSpa_01453 [Colletotrichum spaethianum]